MEFLHLSPARLESRPVQSVVSEKHVLERDHRAGQRVRQKRLATHFPQILPVRLAAFQLNALMAVQLQ
jgi:hypothetical protein